MTREKAIKILSSYKNSYFGDALHGGMISVSEIIELLSAQSENDWIPCSEVTGEGYPNENGRYYVTEQNYGFYLDAVMKQKITHVSCFVDGEFLDRFFNKNASNIVAWCPLPEPYEERREDD